MVEWFKKVIFTKCVFGHEKCGKLMRCARIVSSIDTDHETDYVSGHVTDLILFFRKLAIKEKAIKPRCIIT